MVHLRKERVRERGVPGHSRFLGEKQKRDARTFLARQPARSLWCYSQPPFGNSHRGLARVRSGKHGPLLLYLRQAWVTRSPTLRVLPRRVKTCLARLDVVLAALPQRRSSTRRGGE